VNHRVFPRLSLCIALAMATLALPVLTATVHADAPPSRSPAVGTWQVYDDHGAPDGIVQTFVSNGKLYGKVVKAKPGRSLDETCDKCPPPYKNKAYRDILIMWELVPDGAVWSGGTILDPQSGSTYRCRVETPDSNTLAVRGFVGISLLGRTQNWKRVGP
jgi:uncharacterized protein (DUF2147 family)